MCLTVSRRRSSQASGSTSPMFPSDRGGHGEGSLRRDPARAGGVLRLPRVVSPRRAGRRPPSKWVPSPVAVPSRRAGRRLHDRGRHPLPGRCDAASHGTLRPRASPRSPSSRAPPCAPSATTTPWGFCPLPAERGSWRDYDLSHVVRLSRIRYLVDAGVLLEAVARILDADDAAPAPAQGRGAAAGMPAARAAPGRVGNGAPGPSADATPGPTVDGASAPTAKGTPDAPTEPTAVVADSAASLAAAEEHLAQATRQRDMPHNLLDRAREGSTVSPMPPVMATFFDRMEACAPDERTRTAIRRERDVVDLACYRGLMPPAAVHIFPDPAETEEDAASLSTYGRDSADATDEEIDAQARWITGRRERRFNPDRLRELACTIDLDAVTSLVPAHRRHRPALPAHRPRRRRPPGRARQALA